jgi:cation diffusion facilitator family transporter
VTTATSTTENLTKWAWLSIAAALATIGLKSYAYVLTGSVGLLSDAMESVVNLVAAVLALIALWIASRPADETHHFGHGKAEYFSAGAEGIMIFVAAVLIIVSAVDRLKNPEPLESLGIGLAITLLATAINGVVGVMVLRAGRRHRSITLVADGKHLLTDVWTSAGVIIGVGLVALTGWLPLDSLVAIGVALNILWTGFGLVRHSLNGLMDRALPRDQEQQVHEVLRGVVSRYSTRSRPANRVGSDSSPCTCSSPVSGPSLRGTTSWRQSRLPSWRSSRERTSTPISSLARIRAPTRSTAAT